MVNFSLTSTFLKGVVLIMLLALFNACEEDGVKASNCDSIVALDANSYQNETSDFYTIISASIQENCLQIEYSASGCSGESWKEKMVDEEVILESFPIQRNLKMILDNPEACAAVFTKTVSFDLIPIQTEDYTRIILNIDGYDEPLLYDYSGDSSIENLIQQKWDLVNVNGGLTGIDVNFSEGTITWDFGDEEVIIVNNNQGANAIYDGLATGTYNYSIQEFNDVKILEVDSQNLGVVSIVDGQLTVDQRASDGFQLRFKKH